VARLAGTVAVVAVDTTADVTVEDLARLVDALAGAGVGAAAVAPSLRWPPRLAPYDEAALRAAIAAPAAPVKP